jgi:RNA-directed DNA polymerase
VPGRVGKPATFDFLGFTHICGISQTGKFLLRRLTIKARLRAKLRALRDAMWRRRHQSVQEQGKWLMRVVRGYFAYHAVPTNMDRLGSFRTQLGRHWHKALRRRSQRARMNWARMRRIIERWLPLPRVAHPWPQVRFDVRTQGRSRVR